MIPSVSGFDPPVDLVELPEVLARRYNAAADRYYREFANVDFETNKPFANYREAAMISYQVGLLLCGARIGRAQRILEFGAGAGWLASMLHRLGNEVFLLEISATALDMARETFRRDGRNAMHAVGPHFNLYNGLRFPYAHEQFDRIVCFDALHHVPNPRHILEEMHRVLKPGGIAGFVESGCQHAELPAIRDCVARTGILERNTPLAEVHALASEAGFSEMTVKAFPACDAWEVDYREVVRATKEGRPIVDADDAAAGFGAGNQSIFMLHKGAFQFDGTYPDRPSATIELNRRHLQVAARQPVTLGVRVCNTGHTRFNVAPHSLGGFTALGAHLFRDEEVINFDFLHHPIPSDVECGEACEFQVAFTAPAEPGAYQLEWDIVIEGALWLGQTGSLTARTSLQVTVE